MTKPQMRYVDEPLRTSRGLRVDGADRHGPGADISVIIPAYNSAMTLEAALDSVAAQSIIQEIDGGALNTVVEVIVVDDCSSDDTLGAAQQWLNRISPPPFSFRLSRLPSNGGPAAARNDGISKACGKWVAFLDSDDAWLPHRLAAQITLAEKYPSVAMWCGETIGMEIERGEKRAKGGQRKTEMAGRENLPSCEEITLENLAVENPVATSTVLVKKSVLDKVGGFDEQFRGPEDYDLWLRVAAMGRVVKMVQPLSRYRYVQGSLSLDERRFMPEVLRVLDKAFGSGGVLEGRKALKRAARSTQFWSASWMAFCRGDRWRAVELWVAAYWLNLWTAARKKRKWWPLLLRYMMGRVKEKAES
ncbi:MAG: glycosyltransferase family 2 protein [Lentisphaerae bacterium]|nr:glycosyltransferase family 2 protein [Lentisphaerota bacterium]